MRIEFDISTLHPDKVTGVGVYILQLLQQASMDPDVDLVPVIKLSRAKNRKALLSKIPQKTCRVYYPWTGIFGGRGLFHGPDFKLRNSFGPRIVTIHDMVVFEKSFNEPAFYEKGIQALTSVLQSQPDAILVNSDFTKGEILKYFPNLKVPIIRTYLGCDRLPQAETPTLKLPENYILYVGTLEKRKNIEALLDSFSRYRSFGGSAHLVLSGKWGFGKDEIQKKLKDSPVQEFIQHFEYVPFQNLSELYQRAQIFFFPSLYEGFGIPILEAMSLGTPVITSSCGAMKEIADLAALLVNPHSVEEMAQALLRLDLDVELQDRLTQAGLQRAQDFSWQKCWQETKKVYLQLGDNQK